MVLNILTSPDALDSIQLGTAPLIFTLLLILTLIFFELYLIKIIIQTDGEKKFQLNQKINRTITIPFILVVLSEKIAYGLASLTNRNEIISRFTVIPLYQPLTFNKLANRYFGYKPQVDTQNTIRTEATLNYPIHPLKIEKIKKPFNIFIIASDSVSYSTINATNSPNIEGFKRDSINLKNHFSGGNATRFGIFSLMYGLNSTYWFPFLNNSQGSILFDVLKKQNYDISIISSTNTNWPEFKKTCYVNIQDTIQDKFEGKPWEKDQASSQAFISRVAKQERDKPLFSFLFLDAPHGYSFPPKENHFQAPNREINYLNISPESSELENMKKVYNNAVYYNDKLFGKIVTQLKKSHLYEEALVIYTSDHGQEMFEYGNFGHNSSFSKGQTQTPMIIKLPKSLNIEIPKQLNQSMTSHNDIVPTLLNLLGVKNPNSDYTNGKNIFSKEFKRNHIFSANWNNNAIITPQFTYVFSNLPNKMFRNEVHRNSDYNIVKQKIDNTILLNTINENRRFLK